MGELSVADIVFVSFPFSDLFTANEALINKKVTSLNNATHEKIISAILQILKNGR